jgi:hypothetical protein
MYYVTYIYIIHILFDYIFAQLDFQPADIKHSSLRTMAKHVRRAMLPGNDTVYKKSFAEGKKYLLLPAYCAFPESSLQHLMEIKSRISTGQSQ